MARLVLSPSASGDQADILSNLYSTAGSLTAIKFRGLFRTLYLRLTEFPQSGPLRPALGHEVRIGVVAPYVVIYRYSAADDAVTVLRIVHGRREITDKLLKS